MLTPQNNIEADETGIAETLGNRPVIINADDFDEERLRLIASTSKSQLSADGDQASVLLTQETAAKNEQVAFVPHINTNTKRVVEKAQRLLNESDSDDFVSAHSDESNSEEEGGENGYSPEPSKPKVLETKELDEEP